MLQLIMELCTLPDAAPQGRNVHAAPPHLTSKTHIASHTNIKSHKVYRTPHTNSYKPRHPVSYL